MTTSISLQSTVITGSGFITFDARVSSEQHYDFLKVYVNGVEVMKGSGDRPWVNRIIPVSAGDVVEWSYEKDSSTSKFEDSAWIDNIEFYTVASIP